MQHLRICVTRSIVPAKWQWTSCAAYPLRLLAGTTAHSPACVVCPTTQQTVTTQSTTTTINQQRGIQYSSMSLEVLRYICQCLGAVAQMPCWNGLHGRGLATSGQGSTHNIGFPKIKQPRNRQSRKKQRQTLTTPNGGYISRQKEQHLSQ